MVHFKLYSQREIGGALYFRKRISRMRINVHLHFQKRKMKRRFILRYFILYSDVRTATLKWTRIIVNEDNSSIFTLRGNNKGNIMYTVKEDNSR